MLTGASPQRSAGVSTGASQRRDEIVVELEQGDRAAGHLQRGDVVADQVALDRDALALQELVELVVDDVELDQRRAAHAVDEGEHAVARLVRQVLDDRRASRSTIAAAGASFSR